MCDRLPHRVYEAGGTRHPRGAASGSGIAARDAAVKTTPAYDFQVTDDGEYELVTTDGSLQIEAARVRWFGDDLRSEIKITTEQGITGPLEMTFMKANSMQAVLSAVNGDDVHRQQAKA